MEYIVVIIVAFGASVLTFFSGFGLSTILTPALILFFPPEVAVAAAAIVHLLNNLFKLLLVGKSANINTALRFGIPSMLGAALGALALGWLSSGLSNHTIRLLPGHETNMIGFTLGLLIIIFSMLELIPALRRLEFPAIWIVPGGLISGFFGGLSGHQGALRTAFLIKLGLEKHIFIATGVVIACGVDIIRLSIYGITFDTSGMDASLPLVLSASMSAFAGAYLGKKLLKTLTLNSLQIMVGILMLSIGLLLMLGVV